MKAPSSFNKQSMVLFRNGLLTLEYDPADDIMFVEWPEIRTYTVQDVRGVLGTLVDMLRIYDIKNLLVDSRQSVVELEEKEYLPLMLEFARALQGTRLQRLVRIMTSDPDRERRVARVSEETELAVAYQNFSCLETAVQWLKSENQPIVPPISVQ
jgi:hypothetical protein